MDSMPGGPTDNEIIQHVLSGQSRAFEILLERYAPVVFGIVGRHEPQARVEDIAQEVLYTRLPVAKLIHGLLCGKACLRAIG